MVCVAALPALDLGSVLAHNGGDASPMEQEDSDGTSVARVLQGGEVADLDAPDASVHRQLVGSAAATATGVQRPRSTATFIC
jgi:hypothetical protein